MAETILKWIAILILILLVLFYLFGVSPASAGHTLHTWFVAIGQFFRGLSAR